MPTHILCTLSEEKKSTKYDKFFCRQLIFIDEYSYRLTDFLTNDNI